MNDLELKRLGRTLWKNGRLSLPKFGRNQDALHQILRSSAFQVINSVLGILTVKSTRLMRVW